MAAAMGMQQLAVDQMGRLLDRLAFQIHGVKKFCGGERIHDLRVAIRRFMRGWRRCGLVLMERHSRQSGSPRIITGRPTGV
jgi:CHAD domain-containing protein